MDIRKCCLSRSSFKAYIHVLTQKKVYITYNALKRALELLILFLIKMR